MTTIYQGLRMDIGSAIKKVSVEDGDWYARMGFDVSYFIVITTVLMNVIFGIIIDTFGALRDTTQVREGYFKNTTFIACLDRSEIDKVAQDKGMSQSGWDYLEHNMQHRWNYMNFLFYLHCKAVEELTGPESHINSLCEDGDISWMPLRTCSLMQREDEQVIQEKEKDTLEKSFKELRTNVVEQVEFMMDEISLVKTGLHSVEEFCSHVKTEMQRSHAELCTQVEKALKEATEEMRQTVRQATSMPSLKYHPLRRAESMLGSTEPPLRRAGSMPSLSDPPHS
eukprot:gnl/MRDRNA2_/MRDRNA2_194353_c0_seq1.p1 gnl/MRDRNA2_/MRDRNA2_194353_c0~~gnl/MRDRNA2_/MRDRNA2_194353_c0_seq1.p1  ORF type:complete len:312 (+),score=51.71 gnl/MRDRNA2_/MRDRNA2_194353_c0_seq1:92-937(+)